MKLPIYRPFRLYRYCDFVRTWIFYTAPASPLQAQAFPDASPFPFTGYAVRATARTSPSASSPLFALTSTPTNGSSIVLGGSLGTLTLTIAQALVNTFGPGQIGNMDILFDTPAGTTIPWMTGPLIVMPTNTRPGGL